MCSVAFEYMFVFGQRQNIIFASMRLIMQREEASAKGLGAQCFGDREAYRIVFLKDT